MTPAGCTGELLRRLAAMPFLDRLEMVAVSGWSRGAAYPAVEALERNGLVASVPHASDLIPPTRRFHLTVPGLYRLAREEGMTVDGLLAAYPLSSQWQRLLMERLDAVAAIYRLACAVSDVAHPIRFRWFRALPMDAAVGLPDGRIISIVRQGPTSDRTAFAKRLWRLRKGPRTSSVLILAPDGVRLRHARRLMTGSPSLAFLAPESAAVSGTAGSRVWRTPSGFSLLDLRTALSLTQRLGEWPLERSPARAHLPENIALDATGETLPDWMLPAVLKPAEKRALDLLYDWPWISPTHMGILLGVRRSMLSRVLVRLCGLGLVTGSDVGGSSLLAVTDRGLALLARRDRSAVGAARQRWSPALQDPDGLMEWRNVTGRRSRQLLRNLEHTSAVHWFIAVLSRQARSRSREVVQLDPPRRASRYFRHGDKLRSIHPDAFGVLRRDGKTSSFFLEWERRAVRPATMADRIAPYLRYYSSHRPTDDHGARPAVLVVFESDLAATHFLRVASQEMNRVGVNIPLYVSHKSLLERVGPLGKGWRTTGDSEPGYAFRRH